MHACMLHCYYRLSYNGIEVAEKESTEGYIPRYVFRSKDICYNVTDPVIARAIRCQCRFCCKFLFL